MKELTQTEKAALNICGEFQQLTKIAGINLTNDIRECSKDLSALYQMRRVMKGLRAILPKHEVVDQRTGKVIGDLYDNEYVERVMMATNISINSNIQHTEGHIRFICRSKYILNTH